VEAEERRTVRRHPKGSPGGDQPGEAEREQRGIGWKSVMRLQGFDAFYRRSERRLRRGRALQHRRAAVHRANRLIRPPAWETARVRRRGRACGEQENRENKSGSAGGHRVFFFFR
jgi:hypothetical protein